MWGRPRHGREASLHLQGCGDSEGLCVLPRAIVVEQISNSGIYFEVNSKKCWNTSCGFSMLFCR